MGATATTFGKWSRDQWLTEQPNHPSYDPTRPLAYDEWRCPDCGFIATIGSSADVVHDNLCDEPVDAETGEFLNG